jgi:ubiquinone/menaquinone biosynthesis C-methylase UbiE
MSIDFNSYADAYLRNRAVQPMVLQALVGGSHLGPGDAVLEIGCGTANYLVAIVTETGATGHGIDPAQGMLAEARSMPERARLDLRVAPAESLPFPDGTFRFAFSVDVTHHVGDRVAAARETRRVLAPGGRLCIVTDSHDDITNRIPLASHFPETVPHDLARYPAMTTIQTELADAGFGEIGFARVAYAYPLTNLTPYRERAYSVLRLIPEEAFAAGMARLEQDLTDGPIPACSVYTLVWATKP